MDQASSKSEKPSSQHNPVCPYCRRHFETQDELTLHIVTRHTQIGIKRGPAQAGK